MLTEMEFNSGSQIDSQTDKHDHLIYSTLHERNALKLHINIDILLNINYRKF